MTLEECIILGAVIWAWLGIVGILIFFSIQERPRIITDVEWLLFGAVMGPGALVSSLMLRHELSKECKRKQYEQFRRFRFANASAVSNSGNVTIPVSQIEFNAGGNTIWVQSPSGMTVLRIKCSGKITTQACNDNPVSHADILVAGDIKVFLANDAVLANMELES